ncbi:zinc finger and BTB domain-containing protein 12-like [Cylas formicarius]|uniref:zinc finger and BTB domain-containing protein 12-like n=1 Tax=Cylas formicarius TaxID=197179 RepID=UPI002958DE0F|nr:zinc finger and BTB domain-containing protein 12-like [Cylas formicarius]
MESSEQFSLCWNNFHSNLSSGFHSLLKDEDLVDVTLAAEGKYVKAHRTVLSVCSPFFKDLFRANPCKHPIVILPEVSYGALRSVLHFMYQGEVSVSQEEIPTFMKVAEMLKVKGLTDNSSDATNGFPNSKSSFGAQQILKRPRPPMKKMVRPMPLPFRDGVKLSNSPQPPVLQPSVQPPPKKIMTDPPDLQLQTPSGTQTPSSSPSPQVHTMPLIKPKEEPVDHSEEDTGSQGGMEEMSMDIANMLDTTLGETMEDPSMAELPPPWPPGDMEAANTEDPSQPGTIQCILGRRGNPRLIVDGYVFYKKSVYKGKAFWYCKNSRTPEKCQAVCWTMNGNIVKWPYLHNHPIMPDPFNPEEDSEVPIENLQEVLWQTSLS